MRIIKCDICKKEIKSDAENFQLVRTGNIMTFTSLHICFVCGKPIVKMLKNNNLFKSEKKYGRKK